MIMWLYSLANNFQICDNLETPMRGGLTNVYNNTHSVVDLFAILICLLTTSSNINCSIVPPSLKSLSSKDMRVLLLNDTSFVSLFLLLADKCNPWQFLAIPDDWRTWNVWQSPGKGDTSHALNATEMKNHL